MFSFTLSILTIADPERVEKDYSLLENKLLVSEARVQDLQRLVEGTTNEAELIQEKADIMTLNLGLSERIRYETSQLQVRQSQANCSVCAN